MISTYRIRMVGFFLCQLSALFFGGVYAAARETLSEVIMSPQSEALVGQLHTYVETRKDVCYLAELWAKEGGEQISQVLKIEISRALLVINKRYSCMPSEEVLHEYIAERAKHGDVVSKSNAILVLGMMGARKDIEVLSQIALDEEPLTFYQAVAALAMHETKEADRALSEIANRVRNHNFKDYIKERRYLYP